MQLLFFIHHPTSHTPHPYIQHLPHNLVIPRNKESHSLPFSESLHFANKPNWTSNRLDKTIAVFHSKPIRTTLSFRGTRNLIHSLFQKVCTLQISQIGRQIDLIMQLLFFIHHPTSHTHHPTPHIPTSNTFPTTLSFRGTRNLIHSLFQEVCTLQISQIGRQIDLIMQLLFFIHHPSPHIPHQNLDIGCR